MLPLAKTAFSNPALDLSTVVWCIYIGAVLGWAGVLYNKMVPGMAVRRLLKKQSFSPETASTLKELSLDNGLFRFLLREGSTLRRIVKPDSGDTPPSEKKRKKKENLREMRFYIPEELKYRAEIRYSFRATELIGLVFGAVILLAVAVFLYNFGIPMLLELIDSTF